MCEGGGVCACMCVVGFVCEVRVQVKVRVSVCEVTFDWRSVRAVNACSESPRSGANDKRTGNRRKKMRFVTA